MKAKGFILLSAILIITMCLAVTASAEIVGRTADGYIHRYTADNGQEIPSRRSLRSDMKMSILMDIRISSWLQL